MGFQEPIDSFVEKLQIEIEKLEKDVSHNEFKNILQKIDEQFPFVDLLEFLEMYVDGEYSKNLIEKFHLFGFDDYYKLLRILKLNKKRKSTHKNSESRKINLEDKKLMKRYEFLHQVLLKNQQQIKNKIDYNVLRAIVLLQLFSNGQNYTNKEKIFQTIFQTIQDLEHLVLTKHTSLLTINNQKIKEMLNEIIVDLKENLFLETDEQNNLRLEKHQLFLAEYIFNIIQNRIDGITYQELITTLREKLPIIAQIPNPIIVMTLQDFVDQNKIVRKGGYWKSKPFFDQYFTIENYKKMNEDNTLSWKKNRKFFGRSITPKEFINELVELEKGDFEDQDDQVTRIAGMILTNSNMMSHPPNNLDGFDFAVDLSSYEFTNEQQKIIQNLNLEIKSNIIYVKVMINEKITVSEISDLILELKSRKQNEQGFIISFEKSEKTVIEILEKNKTIQIISKKELEEWCKITPIIPSRRGAVAVVRQGDNHKSIVKIKSINYESGRADIILFPDMEEKTQYIGSLEEITLSIGIKKFVDYSSRYFQFLNKLRRISDIDIFRKIISDDLFDSSRSKKNPEIRIESDKYIKCIFEERFKTKIDLDNHPDKSSLKYSVDDLFSCTCYQWNQKSRTNGLCDHLIYSINESIKKILSSEYKSSNINIERHLQKIEYRMDLFLRRLRYSSNDDSTEAKCPHCGDIAHSIKEVEKKFGFRQMDKENRFSLRRQSRCKKCR